MTGLHQSESEKHFSQICDCVCGTYRVALSVDSVSVTGEVPDNETDAPTMVSTFSELGGRPYIDALLEVNPLDGTCSARVIVFVQSMRIVFDAVSTRLLHSSCVQNANFLS